MFNIDREPCLPGCGGSGGVRIFLCAVFHLISNIFLWRSKTAPLQLQFVLLNRSKDKLERINVFLSSAIYIYLFLYVRMVNWKVFGIYSRGLPLLKI